MYRLTSRLIVYRNIDRDSILQKIAEICREAEPLLPGAQLPASGRASVTPDREALAARVLDQVHRLLDVATEYGFNRNLWQDYLAFLLATTETPFTLVAEKRGAVEGAVNTFVKSDLWIFRRLFDYDFAPLGEALGVDCFRTITDYHAVAKTERFYNKSVSEKVRLLSDRIAAVPVPAADADAAAVEAVTDTLYGIVTDFYRDYGVGTLGLNKAFRLGRRAVSAAPGQGLAPSPASTYGAFKESLRDTLLIPITATSDVVLDDLIGYEPQKEKLVANTEAFVSGRPANNVLLYGDAGTGKSTSIKAILNQYYDRGLRMIEIYKHELEHLQTVINYVKNRNYRFIIYMDDLSFEDHETEYKYLKAVIEGGLEMRPENVLIYATSNRRHLIRENWSDRSDRSDDEMHRSDTVQEKTSLAARFGVTIGYLKPSAQEYRRIVKELARRYPQIRLTEEELLQKANAWEVRNGSTSGRTAQQFIDYLAGLETQE